MHLIERSDFALGTNHLSFSARKMDLLVLREKSFKITCFLQKLENICNFENLLTLLKIKSIEVFFAYDCISSKINTSPKGLKS